MQFISLLAGVEQQVVECFHHGGGVPYSAYERFHALMAEDSANSTTRRCSTASFRWFPVR